MKVCIVGDARSPHIRHLCAGLAGEGLTPHVVTHHPVDLVGATVEKYEIPPASLTNPRRWSSRRAHYLRGLLRSFDVVNVHFLHDWGFTPELIDEGCVVATAWGSDIVQPPGELPPSAELVEARLAMLRRASAVTTCGPTFARMVADFAGLDADRVSVVPFGVDTERFRPPERSERRTQGTHRVGFFKGFRPVYGPETLMRAVPIVLESLPNTHLDLVGDGDQREACQSLASALGVRSFLTWIPRQPSAGIAELLAGWDLTVIPSVAEAFGVAALESSAMGVPVVASNVGGLVDTVVDGKTGVLVPPSDPQALADGIISLLSDDALRCRMALAGRAFVEHRFRLDAVAREWVELYDFAIETASSGRMVGAR